MQTTIFVILTQNYKIHNLYIVTGACADDADCDGDTVCKGDSTCGTYTHAFTYGI